jgi:hypothetical protein
MWAKFSGELAGYFRTLHALNVPNVTSRGTVEQDLNMVMAGEPDTGLICVFGSLYMTGAIRGRFGLS